MKKNGLLNTPIAQVVDALRHTDMLTIGDCGLPIPVGVKEIDLALTLGVPHFLEVLDTMLKEVKVEKVWIAEEIVTYNLGLYRELEERFSTIEMVLISHEELKEKTNHSKAIIRTGEATPYANIILQSAVIF